MKKKYILHPGFIKSKYDGEIHYISCGQLALLYRIDIKECILDMGENSLRGLNLENYIHLYPKYNGEYIIKEHK